MAPLLVKTIGMKRRADRNPQRERWIQIIGFSILGGITLGLLIDRLQEPITYVKVAEAQEVEQEQVALIRVVYDKAGIERLIRETFPEEPNTAVAIAKAESGLVATAYNPEAHRSCNGSVGVFQIACVHTRDKESLKDVETNIKKAREIYLREGWRPWGAYTDGRYKEYLK